MLEELPCYDRVGWDQQIWARAGDFLSKGGPCSVLQCRNLTSRYNALGGM